MLETSEGQFYIFPDTKCTIFGPPQLGSLRRFKYLLFHVGVLARVRI
jgi:hypothetical protein